MNEYSMRNDCSKISNNRYKKCPALMADARTFTDYRSSCYVNSALQQKNGIMSSEEYRRFLVSNGNKILEQSDKYFKHQTNCNTKC